jgi:Polyketide cyclase / dehydrase and lipid transport
MTQANETSTGEGGVMSQLPMDRLKAEVQEYGKALGQHGLDKVGERIEGITGKLTDLAEGGAKGSMKGKTAMNAVKGDSPVKAVTKAVASKAKDTAGGAVSGLTGGNGGGDGGKKLKVTNIVEYVDVPVSRDVAYAQWTEFEEFPSFMKKVENVKQESDEVVTWQAQVFWSHRSWKATIVDQVPGERIVWKSQGDKGRVDGAVTFHELAPDLTRVLATLEYHPKGLFEHTGNLWRAQGRRVRLEMKHFRRHVAVNTLLHQDEVDGWQGEIHDEKVTSSRGGGRKGGRSGGSSQSSRRRSGTAKKSSSSGTTRKRTAAAKGTASKRSTSAAKKSTSSAAKKSTSSAAKKTAPKKTAPKKSTSTAKKTPAKKTAAKKTATKRTTARRSSGSKG